jgi:AcrR family transcriptional regulator
MGAGGERSTRLHEGTRLGHCSPQRDRSMADHDDQMTQGAMNHGRAASVESDEPSTLTAPVIDRSDSTPAVGLRETKLRRTRAQLIETAVALLLDVGYEKATVDRITAASDVSARTFSRYFASKDAVFLAVLEPVMDAVLDELNQLPYPCAPLEALRAAHVAVLARVADQPMGTPSADQLAVVFHMVCSSTALRARIIQYRDERVMTTLAEKMGVPRDDYRIQLAVTMFNVAAVTAWTVVEPDRISPAVAVQRMQTVLADVVDAVDALDVRSLRASTATAVTRSDTRSSAVVE